MTASHKIDCHVSLASDPPQSLAGPPQSPPDPQSLADPSAGDIGGALAHPLQQNELQLQNLQPLSARAFQQHLPQQLQGQGFGQACVLAQAFVSQLILMLVLT